MRYRVSIKVFSKFYSKKTIQRDQSHGAIALKRISKTDFQYMRHFSHDISFVYPPKVETAIMQMFHQTIIFHAQGFFAINYTTMLQVEYECHYVIKVALFILVHFPICSCSVVSRRI